MQPACSRQRRHVSGDTPRSLSDTGRLATISQTTRASWLALMPVAASCTPSSTCCSLMRAVFRRGSRLPSFFDCLLALRAFFCCGQYSSSLLLSLSSLLLLLLLLLLLPPPPDPRRFRAMSD